MQSIKPSTFRFNPLTPETCLWYKGKDMKQPAEDYNHIAVWLDPHLIRLGLSVEKFADRCQVSRASLYFYLKDTCRPSTGVMARICRVLGVPLEEGLRQFTPRKGGRPAGSGYVAVKKVHK
jgi:DNA-binding XRE family transcriptional regulator